MGTNDFEGQDSIGTLGSLKSNTIIIHSDVGQSRTIKANLVKKKVIVKS